MSYPSTTPSEILESKSSKPESSTNTLTQPQPSEIPIESSGCDVLILSGSIGAGHHVAAQAIAESLHKADPTLTIEIADFFVTFKNIIATATKKIYLNTLKLSPRMYELLFAETRDRAWTVKILNHLADAFMHRKLMRFLQEKKPRMLISTFPIWNLLLGKAWEDYSNGNGNGTSGEIPVEHVQHNTKHLPPRQFPFISFITDTNTVHCAWALGDADYYIVSNNQTRHALHEQGVPLKKIKPLGYPVALEFTQSTPRAEFLESIQLRPTAFTALVIISNVIRTKKITTLLKKLAQYRAPDFQAIFIAYGVNDEVLHSLQEIKWPFPTHVSGWTNELHHYMNAADLVLTKAGGNTIMQCIYAKKPLMIIDVLPGQEEGNALLVQQSGCGIIAQDTYDNVAEGIDQIRINHKNFTRNASRLSKPNAMADITTFLLSLLKSA